MNKSNTSFTFSALSLVLVSFFIAPMSVAMAGENVSGIIKTQVCDSFLAAEEKKDEKGGKKGEEEPDCE